jgi:hypothetical protein
MEAYLYQLQMYPFRLGHAFPALLLRLDDIASSASERIHLTDCPPQRTSDESRRE